MMGFTPADDEPLWGLTVTEPAGPAGSTDRLMTELLDIEDDIATAVIWIAEHWSSDLPPIRCGTGDPFNGYVLRLSAAASTHGELNHLAQLLDVPVAATGTYGTTVLWQAKRSFGTVLFDAYYGEPVGDNAARYLAAYLDKATQPEAGAT
jgi:hypothetical protein